MNKLAYDLALLCVEHGLREFNPSGYEESADFALRTFKATYDHLIKSGEPLLDSFSPNT